MSNSVQPNQLDTSHGSRRFHKESLEKLVAEILIHSGATAADGQCVADVLVSADARGVSSHGLRTLVHHVATVRDGGVRSPADISVVRETPISAVVDGGGGFGAVTSVQAMALSIEKARATGIGIVLARNSNHFGAAGHYALMAVPHGLLGFASSNASPIMTITGSRSKAISNAPFAYAVPGPRGPIHLDIAMSASAGMRIRSRAKAGDAIPEGWILDRDGNSTTDPTDYERGGALLPMALHKGSGLAILGEIFNGVLSGAGILSDIVPWLIDTDQHTNAGHAFVSLDPGIFLDASEWQTRIARLDEELHSKEPAAGVDQIFLPGERENIAEHDADVNGVPLGLEALEILDSLTANTPLASQLELARQP